MNEPVDKPTASTSPSSNKHHAMARLRKTLRDALSKVDSPESAEEIVRQLEEKAVGQSTSEIAAKAPNSKSATEAATQVEQVGQRADAQAQAADVLAETARVIAEAKGKESEALASAAQSVLNPELHGKDERYDDKAQQREYLRDAILNRLKPLDALDARLFLRINHLPHNALFNGFFYFITRIFTGGAIWLVLIQIVKRRHPQLGQRAFRETALPIVLATTIVELPMKQFFRRHRPFIADIKAISVGIKPNSWSFPSGHAAAAFSGAWLLKRFFPKQRGLLYAFASLCVFSRVYLGDHYPGDVISGSIFGIVLAKCFQALFSSLSRAFRR